MSAAATAFPNPSGTSANSDESINRHEASIDALRGLAILGVLAVHSTGIVPAATSLLHNAQVFGHFGVQLFFLVSGLTLCRSWENRRPFESIPIRAFYLRRLFRIAPMFYMALVIHLAVYGVAPHPFAPQGVSTTDIALTAAFLNGFHPSTMNAVVRGGWSVAVEMGFYLAFPLLASLARSLRGALFLFAASCCLYALTRMGAHALWSDWPPAQGEVLAIFIYQMLPSQLPVFAVAFILHRCRDSSRKRLVPPLLVVTGLMIGTIILSRNSDMGQRIFSHHIPVSLVLGLFVLWFLLVRIPGYVLAPLAFLGRLSFSIYLLHFVVVDLAERYGLHHAFGSGDLASILFLAAITGVSTLAAWPCRKWIELPGIQRGRTVITSLRTTSRHAPTA